MQTPDSRASHAADVPEPPGLALAPADARATGRRRGAAKCTICNRPIERNETEFELEFFAPLSGGAATFRLHGRCFSMWEELHAGPWATRTRHEPLSVES
jgi:hypothetical protein